MVKLRTLGECVIEVGEHRVAPDSKVVFALLLYLGLECGKRFTRSALMEMFWPDSAPDRAAHSLRQTIYQCRKLGARLEATKTDVKLSAELVEYDLELLGGATGSVDARDFLPGYSYQPSRLFGEWIERQRNFANAKARRSLLTQMSQLKLRGAWDALDDAARNLLHLDPLNEEATLVLAEATAMRGNKVGAIRILERFEIEVGTSTLHLPSTVLRKRIAEQLQDGGPQVNPFIGREKAMEFLMTLLRDATKGHGRVALMWGEPGIGKSRLVAEFAGLARLQGLQVARMDCQVADSARPFSAFTEILPSMLGFRGALGCSPTSLALLNRLTNLEFRQQAEGGLAIQPEESGDKVRGALLDVADAVCSEKPLVLIIEDVHWLDKTSWEILGVLTNWSAERRIFILLTSRNQQSEHTTNDSFSRMLSYSLGPLSPIDARSLFTTIAADAAYNLEEDEEAWLMSVGEGNPYFIRELARQYAETGTAYSVPASLEGLLLHRVKRISSSALRLLQVAALLGRHSTFQRFEKVLQSSPVDLLASLEELETADLVSSDGNRVMTKHALLSDQAARLCPPATQRLLRRRIAQVLEEEVQETHSATVLWACAEQWQLAGENIRGGRVARECASHLMSLGLATEAIEILKRASTIATDAQEKHENLRALSVAYHAGKHWSRAAEVLEEARQMAQESNSKNSPEHSEEELRLLDAYWRAELNGLGDRGCEYYMQRIRGCLSSVESTPSHRIAAAVKGLIFADADFAVSAMDDFYSSVGNLACNDVASANNTQVAKLIYETCRGDLENAVLTARVVIARAREQGRTFDLLIALLNASLPLRFAGEFREAQECLAEVVTSARERKLWNTYVGGLDALATVNLNQDRIVEAREFLSKTDDVIHLVDDNLAVMSCGRMHCLISIAEGDYERAMAGFSPTQREFSSGMSRGRNEVQSLQTILDVEGGRSANLTFLDDLRRSHLRARNAGKQDLLTTALVIGLCASARKTQGDLLFKRYLSDHRREQYPFPRHLRTLVEKWMA